MKSMGVCIGASNISYVLLEEINDKIHIIESSSLPHDGHPFNLLTKLFDQYKLNTIDKVAVTGRKFKHLVNASTLSEPEAIEYAYQFQKDVYKDIDIILSAGGETFMVYELDQEGRIINVHTGNKCASGTGEFFLQQIKRMGLSMEEAMSSSNQGESYKVAGRCSVFCKSDCTHALNKGTPKENVISGLCEMMGKKLLELMKKSNYDHALLIGGTSQNTKMLDYLKQKVSSIQTPEYAYSYEALGTALWALRNETKSLDGVDMFLNKNNSSFSFLPDLKQFEKKVNFKKMDGGQVDPKGSYVLGLDVGSTTTKAVLIKDSDKSIVASCYLRTNGDPIGASRECYRNLQQQVGENIKITGLGVTGSGRQIAGLHALTPSVMNEIIAHATAAVFFDPEVDTIFEIGGQDAKYTYITNGVPSDYAMNEACSAGTGSFLEEAALESLDLEMTEIEKHALKSKRPPNFSDQCAAFISSDIKSAIQEGISVEDITAGLVYSICMNYTNRVKGNRPIGKKIFMQGGVCYNQAVPIAMSSLTGKEIIVPPNPGLMGAFGAALETQNKLELGFLSPMDFNLEELGSREVSYKSPFVCAGGKEKCDRKCEINRIIIEDKTYPFGGACNKYDRVAIKDNDKNIDNANLVAYREHLVFNRFSKDEGRRIVEPHNKKMGILNSFLSNSLYPLFYNFFYALGFDIVTPSNVDEDGIERKSSAFCYPVELSHGLLSSLLKENTDYIFIPHIKSVPVEKSQDVCVTCPFVQAEPYFLQSCFKELKDRKVLSPVLDFSKDYANQKEIFIKMGLNLGFKRSTIDKAFEQALKAQLAFHTECKTVGKTVLKELEENPEDTAIVLFGRPYNAFSKIGNMGIPHKFASRNYRIIPHDFIPYQEEANQENMYWAMGEMIIKAAKFVKKHNQLYGTYITNFSCGPDSFVVGYFRNVMEKKPSLTLELDSHTADAGIDTRIEAFLDIVKSYRLLESEQNKQKTQAFSPAKAITENNQLLIMDSQGKKYPLTHPKVHVLIPSMGDIGSRLLAATLRYAGIKATAVHSPTERELQLGRSHSSCKECIPLMLTVGSLIDYLETRGNSDELLVYFMPETSGPCRFGQYNILMKNVIEKRQLENVALFSLTSENGYAGLGNKVVIRAWQSIIISDLLDDIYSAVLVLSKDKTAGLYKFYKVVETIIKSVEKDPWKDLKATLEKSAKELQEIEKAPFESAAKIGLIGEIYVRRDQFSRQNLIERLADKNIMVKTSPIAEWMYYLDYYVINKLGPKVTMKDQIRTRMMSYFKSQFEKNIKSIFATTGLYEYHLINVSKLIDNVSDIISPRLTGEAILTVGAAVTEIIEEVDGVISIGPFGCMPGRIAEALITDNINTSKSKITDNPTLVKAIQEKFPKLPFLSIEIDGNVLPQVTEARLESLCLQVNRLHEEVLSAKSSLHNLKHQA
jgi:predicted CoA-substrate-specific enzyme activase